METASRIVVLRSGGEGNEKVGRFAVSCRLLVEGCRFGGDGRWRISEFVGFWRKIPLTLNRHM